MYVFYKQVNKHILDCMLSNLLLIGICYQKKLEDYEGLSNILSRENGIYKSVRSDSTFKAEKNLSLKLRLSRTFNSTISRIRTIQKGRGGESVLDLFVTCFGFCHSHIEDLIY